MQGRSSGLKQNQLYGWVEKKEKLKQPKAFVEERWTDRGLSMQEKNLNLFFEKKSVKSSRGFPSFISFHPFLFWFQILSVYETDIM